MRRHHGGWGEYGSMAQRRSFLSDGCYVKWESTIESTIGIFQALQILPIAEVGGRFLFMAAIGIHTPDARRPPFRRLIAHFGGRSSKTTSKEMQKRFSA